MLSFFSKKKHSPENAPEEVIQGPGAPQQSNGTDDFIFIEKKLPDQPTPAQGSAGMYPPMPPPFGAPYPGANYAPAAGSGGSIGSSSSYTQPYVQGVPFELAPQLCSKSDFELTQLQVDGILAVMTRQMSVEEQDEYNFNLERSIKNECY